MLHIRGQKKNISGQIGAILAPENLLPVELIKRI